jgi:putative selenate reductase FAD-binding subunit
VQEKEQEMIQKYLRPTAMAEALECKSREKEKAYFLAGGTELLRLNSPLHVETAVDLQDLDLSGVSITEDGIRIGGCTTFTELLDHKEVPDFLKTAVLYAGSRTLRNAATIAGNIAAMRWDSYLLPVCIAAKVRLELADLGDDGLVHQESVPIREFISHPEVYRDSLIAAVLHRNFSRSVVSERLVRSRQAPPEFSAAIGADIRREEDGNCSFSSSRVVLAGRGIRSGNGDVGVFRLTGVEQAINSGDIADEQDLVEAVRSEVLTETDQFGSAGYRRYLASAVISDLYNRMRTSACSGETSGEGR